ncbi:MAG: pyridoxamine 5'-phosphate oxidase family protein [Syntrophomonadaceae bacterium]|nr:pyridoxamine 5'-phosphate oxidase family protein [Syntrophomonadaceae bacterium]
MDLKNMVEFANKNAIAWIATVEGDQPRVRPLGMWFADEGGFYFQTAASKDLYQQLQKNPIIEAAFYESGEGLGRMMRLSGRVEFLDDPELKTKVIMDRPFLKQFGLRPDSPDLIIFRLSHGAAHFWTMKDNMKPKTIIKF